MDYHRIYAEFIKDRLKKQKRRGWHKLNRPTRTDYFEKHHIVPRCIGGSDKASNIIRLAPGDHFFAHLLLAKMHGGKLWAPIAFMLGGDRYRAVVSRGWYDWAARAMAQAKSGSGAYQYDHTIYRLVNHDGRRWRGKQDEMHTRLGIDRPFANMLIKGRVKTARGWCLEGTNPKWRDFGGFAGSNHSMYRHEIRTFCHVDGRTFVGTQFELHKAHGLTKAQCCNLVKGNIRISRGWHLEGAKILWCGRARGYMKQAVA